MDSRPTFSIMLQTYPGDIKQAEALVDLIVAIEKFNGYENKDLVEFVIVYTRECDPMDVSGILIAASQVFHNIAAYRSNKRGTGWPFGPNDLWQEGMKRMSMKKASRKTLSQAVLTIEPDSVPMLTNWIQVLMSEWELAFAAGKKVVGHRCNEPRPHINGNGIFSIRLTAEHPNLGASDGSCGWDVEHGREILGIAQETDFIDQRYNRASMSPEELFSIRKNGQIPALLHGIKSLDGIDAISKALEDGKLPIRL